MRCWLAGAGSGRCRHQQRHVCVHHPARHRGRASHAAKHRCWPTSATGHRPCRPRRASRPSESWRSAGLGPHYHDVGVSCIVRCAGADLGGMARRCRVRTHHSLLALRMAGGRHRRSTHGYLHDRASHRRQLHQFDQPHQLVRTREIRAWRRGACASRVYRRHCMGNRSPRALARSGHAAHVVGCPCAGGGHVGFLTFGRKPRTAWLRGRHRARPRHGRVARRIDVVVAGGALGSGRRRSRARRARFQPTRDARVDRHARHWFDPDVSPRPRPLAR